jgi:hypothetical protein
MKRLFLAVLVSALAATGCAITDYPVINDDRGGYSGIIRTGHKAYIQPTSQIATLWDDGSDELFSMVYQNQYGDQQIYTFNNFDQTASVLFLDQTYCDWRYDGCEIVRAWNPNNANIDNVFDYEFFPECSGARSLSLLVSNTSRVGECGDALFLADKQDLMAEFANFATTSWRGGTAYVVPMHDGNMTVSLNGTQMPLFGQYTGFVTENLNFVLPMTPNARHNLSWLASWIAQNGNQAVANISYGSVGASVDVSFAANGINHNLGRF